ncbi:hypothetical protein E2C01_073924 [Portunus trituberculatus]|uniref:Uncharacterized protein n=1 Tax=Portunus trituberculatus TaxID=210409 RepID=A0A5B7IEZ1_PORTR|nr:hypothetical protein [Portunus trituberculatus]
MSLRQQQQQRELGGSVQQGQRGAGRGGRVAGLAGGRAGSAPHHTLRASPGVAPPLTTHSHTCPPHATTRNTLTTPPPARPRALTCPMAPHAAMLLLRLRLCVCTCVCACARFCPPDGGEASVRESVGEKVSE